jgi:hypothetical protein
VVAWIAISLAAIFLVCAMIRPANPPTYLTSLKPYGQGAGWAVYRVRDTSQQLQDRLLREMNQPTWTSAGNITGVDTCNNYISNRFLCIEWGWPPEYKGDLYIKVVRRSLLEGLLHDAGP